MCDFANMGGGNNPYAQRFQQFEQTHPQFQKAWGALQGAASPLMNGISGLPGMQNAYRPPAPPVQQPGTSVPTMSLQTPMRQGATSA